MQYVTHEQCRAANELGLTLSIHMVKRRALSDPSNLETVRMLCETYPRSKRFWLIFNLGKIGKSCRRLLRHLDSNLPERLTFL